MWPAIISAFIELERLPSPKTHQACRFLGPCISTNILRLSFWSMIYIYFNYFPGVCPVQSREYINWVRCVAVYLSDAKTVVLVKGHSAPHRWRRIKGKSPKLFFVGAIIANYALDFFQVASAYFCRVMVIRKLSILACFGPSPVTNWLLLTPSPRVTVYDHTYILYLKIPVI